MYSIDDTIHAHLSAIGIKPEVRVPIMREIVKWVRCNGMEWTAKRIKTLKAMFLQVASGATHVQADPAIKMRNGLPRGAFRPLFKMLEGVPFHQALRVFQVSGLFRLARVTPAQWKKFCESVEQPLPTRSGWEINIEPELMALGEMAWRHAKYIPLAEWCGEEISTRAPIRAREGKTWDYGTLPVRETTIRDHLRQLDSVFDEWLVRCYPAPFRAIGIEVKPTRGAWEEYVSRVRMGKEPLPYGSWAGCIGLIQESGAKLRAVANPARVYQAVLSRLGNALFHLMETSLPWDCTFDQARGIRWVQRKLNEGRTMYSVDLSDATNQFPLELQLNMIGALMPKDIEAQDALEIVRQLSHRTRWRLPDQAARLHGRGWISWKKGQPLGLYPSFGLFAVTHGLVLRAIERDLGLVDTFRVLGDDVVIGEPRVHERYRTFLVTAGCPVSETKTLASQIIGEFAGKIITAKGAVVAEKWKPFQADDPLGFLRMYGHRGSALVPKKWREQICWFASLPEPVGLGQNGEGNSLEERIRGVVDLFEDKIEVPRVPAKPLLEIKSRLADAFFIEVDGVRRTCQPVGLNYRFKHDLLNPPTREDSRRMVEHLNAALSGRQFLDYNLPTFLREMLELSRSKRLRGHHDSKKRTWLQTIVRWFRRRE